MAIPTGWHNVGRCGKPATCSDIFRYFGYYFGFCGGTRLGSTCCRHGFALGFHKYFGGYFGWGGYLGWGGYFGHFS